jgi:hypothetical protein
MYCSTDTARYTFMRFASGFLIKRTTWFSYLYPIFISNMETNLIVLNSVIPCCLQMYLLSFVLCGVQIHLFSVSKLSKYVLFNSP